MEELKENKVDYIPMVERAFNIIELLYDSGEGMGVSEIAAQLQLPKATVYRILATMEKMDLLVVLQGVDNGVEGSVDHNLGLLLGNAGFFRHGSNEFSLVHRLILLNSVRRRGLRGVYEQKALPLLVI